MNRTDSDGMADYFTNSGKFIKSYNNKKDSYIYIQKLSGNEQQITEISMPRVSADGNDGAFLLL